MFTSRDMNMRADFNPNKLYSAFSAGVAGATSARLGLELVGWLSLLT